MPLATGKLVKVGTGRSQYASLGSAQKTPGQAYTAHRELGGSVTWRIDGIDKLMANLNRELHAIQARSVKGMKIAARNVLRYAGLLDETVAT